MLRRWLLPLVLALAACGPEVGIVDDYTDHDLGKIESGLTAGQAGGCDTSIVAGLTAQLVAELNCITPSSMTNFTGPGISVTSAVNPFLAPGATNGLKAAVSASGNTIGISSAYRSVAQQYLLYKWWQAGQCGIQIAAAPGNSNHQSGRAIDVPSYSAWITPLQAHGWQWYGSGDLVHFDFNGAANLGSASVLAFQRLWNKNNANKLVEDGAWGPASSGAMASAPTTGFPISGCTPPPPPPPTNGTLKGFVYKLNPANAADVSQALAGVTVKAGGQTLTTDATGLYTAQLPPGAVTISVTHDGYAPASLTKQVVSAQTVWGSIGLTPVGTPDTRKPTVEVTSPTEGERVQTAAVTVTGTASDDSGVVKELTLSVNGAAPVALTPGAFSTAVTLKSGPNVLSVVAVDGAGNRTQLDRKVTLRTGLTGVVTAEEGGLPLEGVQLRLLDVHAAVTSTLTSADGSYEFAPAPGSYTLIATLAGYAEYRQPVDVAADALTTWSFSLSKGVAGEGVRFIYPREGEGVLTSTVWVSGVVDGFSPKKVSVNGISAQLLEGGRFTVELPLAPGDNLLEASATKDDDTVVVARLPVVRLDGKAFEESARVRGGCSAAPGSWVFGLLLLVGLVRRR